MEWITNPEIWISLFTLTMLEIVLGIDNIVFITILADNLPENQREKARQYGLVLALGTRILLLLSLNWLIGLTNPIVTAFGFHFSGKDLILVGGGLFLLGKSTLEIHEKLEGAAEGHGSTRTKVTFAAVLMQIMLLDVVFSLDSVITAVGMANEIWVMITAVIISVGIMLVSLNGVSKFVSDHPTVKMLALSFLLLIGFSLVGEGFHQHINKGYIYFAMGFSVFVELINMRLRNKSKTDPIKLRDTHTVEESEA